MKREPISSVAVICVLFISIVLVSRSGSTQSAISDCKQPFGNPACHSSSATFNNGQNTGCKVDFHWLRCDGVSHGSVYDSCTNIGCKQTCSCSCATNGYGLSWFDNCTDTVKSESFSCNGCGGAAGGGGNCTTAGWNGDCPPGTEPDGYGWCCAAGGCGGDVALAKDSSAENPSPNIANPSCCDDYQRLQCYQGGGEWYESQCACYSPVVIDVAGNGFDLTNAANGVMFDLPGAGVTERLSWTSANSDDAWLALDRNDNGIIDNGKELFGTFTAQPALSPGESKNGFRALAMFDTPAYGGNADGQIDTRDAIFSNLKLWQDRNHNGFSEGEELQNLWASELRVIELNYKESRRKDENGNWFRYRARVRDERGAQAGRWAWDVYLQKPH